MKKLRLIFVFFIAVSVGAQTKIKDGSVSGGSLIPNANSILELESSNKGLLLPRVKLDSTGLPSPLSSHIEGMTVYNIRETADVSPGMYYNDGSKWRALSVHKPVQFSTDSVVSLKIGENFIYYKKDVPLNPSSPLLRNHFSDVPVLEGLRLEAFYYDNTYYIPRWYNVSGTTQKYTYTSVSTLTNNYDEANKELPGGAFENVDGDGIVYCSPSSSETVTADLLINDKWYRIIWYVFIDRSININNTAYTVRISITRLH